MIWDCFFVLLILPLIFIFCFFHFTIIFGKDLNFKALEILTFEEGNLIVGKKEAEAKIDNELEIYADKFTYDKNESFNLCSISFNFHIFN